MNCELPRTSGALLVVVVLFAQLSVAQDQPAKLTVHWEKVVRVSQTTPTLQVVVNPPLRRGTPVHDNAFKALHDLQADYVRYVPWLPYPKLGVAELEPPADGKTSWDFATIDPMTIDFLDATKGTRSFSTSARFHSGCTSPISSGRIPRTQIRSRGTTKAAPNCEIPA